MIDTINSKQKRYLKQLAHHLSPVVHVGKAGVTEQVISAIADALNAHELIKIRLHEPEDKKSVTKQIIDSTGSLFAALVGHTVILYKPHPEEPQIQLSVATRRRATPDKIAQSL